MHTEVLGGRTLEEALDEITGKLSGTYKLEVKKSYNVLETKHLKTYKYDSETDELTELDK